MNILVIDEESLLHQQVDVLLRGKSLYDLYFSYVKEEFCAKIITSHFPDIVMINLDTFQGKVLNFAMWLQYVNPTIKILGVTSDIKKVYLWELMSSGFQGCMDRRSIQNDIVESIDTVFRNGFYFPSDMNFYKEGENKFIPQKFR